MNGFFDIYTLLFLVLAVVIFLRLRSVLGRRTGNERPPFDPYSARNAPGGQAAGDKVVTLPRRQGDDAQPQRNAAPAGNDWGDIAPAGSDLAKGLDAIKAADRSFDAQGFLNGAKSAYEMIVTGYAEGDRKGLRSLLSRDVYDSFVSSIAEREQRGETMTTNFVGVEDAKLTGAAMNGKEARVTVRFVSQVVTVTRDSEQNVIAGDPKAVTELVDVWTFARDTASRDPNWKLVETEAAE